MVEDWTAEVVGRMHRLRISNSQLAQRAGTSPTYLSTVLNGHKGSEEMKDKIFKALDSLEAEIMESENR